MRRRPETVSYEAVRESGEERRGLFAAVIHDPVALVLDEVGNEKT